jgi:PAS domain S-box-containing protein
MEGKFEVENASSENEALGKINQQWYDAIVSDYEMPNKNGLEFLMELKNRQIEIPFIMFTGKGREEIAIKALNLGADGYFNKHGLPETVYGELIHGIELSIKSKRTHQSLKESQEQYRALFANMINGLAYCQIILDEKNQPKGFVYLDVNDSFIKLTGLKKENIVGKKNTIEMLGIEKSNPELFEICGRVALTGKEEKFEIYSKRLGLWLSVFVYCPEREYFVTIFENITDRKNTEESLRAIEVWYKELSTDLQNVLLELTKLKE